MLPIPDSNDPRWKIYGPYERVDGRKHVIIIEKDSSGQEIDRETRSYPKFLAECWLSLNLKDSETVDHVDRDLSNDDPWNLRVIDKERHSSDDALRVVAEPVACRWCGSSFTPTRNQHNTRALTTAGPFCSKTCSSKYGSSIRNGELPLERLEIKKKYYRIEKDISSL